MRSLNVVQMFAVVVALVATSSAASDSSPTIASDRLSSELKFPFSAAEKTDNNEKHFLRFLKVPDKPVAGHEEEERAINFSFLKNIQKKLAGTAAFKAAKAAAAQKTAQTAKEEAAIVTMLKMSDSRQDLLHLQFRQWNTAKKTPSDVVDDVTRMMKSQGWSRKQANNIGTQYYAWRLINMG
ncbi:Elongation of very long chain fatty acids protein 2 [Phytophthora nicotianae]|uniref:RxLR effector protein n=1 Tax=Phytophthora nicotianae TaxID=4792 RepID=A0A0W8DR46_PHYNI|nr:Elongation of very long chain fatty acids protein 2 [Phytophthora nicotianae]